MTKYSLIAIAMLLSIVCGEWASAKPEQEYGFRQGYDEDYPYHVEEPYNPYRHEGRDQNPDENSWRPSNNPYDERPREEDPWRKDDERNEPGDW